MVCGVFVFVWGLFRGCFRLVFVYMCGRVGGVGERLWVRLRLSCLLVGRVLVVFPRVIIAYR